MQKLTLETEMLNVSVLSGITLWVKSECRQMYLDFSLLCYWELRTVVAAFFMRGHFPREQCRTCPGCAIITRKDVSQTAERCALHLRGVCEFH